MDREKLLDLCRRALAAARPYVLEGRGSWEDSRRAGMLIDQALAELGLPQESADWDEPNAWDASQVIEFEAIRSARAGTSKAE
jgi:hypothetical protein